MRRKTELPELLAPAGSFECLVAAVAAGADAIYVGGRRFGARAFARNFDIDELKKAVRYCHLWGVKLYVTVNTLIEDKELSEVFDYVGELCEFDNFVHLLEKLFIRNLFSFAYEHQKFARGHLFENGSVFVEIAYKLATCCCILGQLGSKYRYLSL